MLYSSLGRAVHGYSPHLSCSLLGNKVLEDCYFGSETRHKSGYYFSLLLNLEKKALISFAVGRGGWGGEGRQAKSKNKLDFLSYS